MEETIRLTDETMTVEGHRGRIIHKLDIHDLAGLVRYAVRVVLVMADG